MQFVRKIRVCTFLKKVSDTKLLGTISFFIYSGHQRGRIGKNGKVSTCTSSSIVSTKESSTVNTEIANRN